MRMDIIKDSAVRGKYLRGKPYADYFSKELWAYTQLVEYKAGEYVLEQEAASQFLYLMVEGRCSVRVLLANGKMVILRTLKAPSLIGEIELVEELPSFSVQALERCRMLAIPLDVCRSRLLGDPYFLRRVCSDLVKKERIEALKLIHSFGYPLENRLAHFILENRQENLFLIKKVHIAESLGVSYRHVEKVMNDFVVKGYLAKHRLVYEITDERRLLALSKDLEI